MRSSVRGLGVVTCAVVLAAVAACLHRARRDGADAPPPTALPGLGAASLGAQPAGRGEAGAAAAALGPAPGGARARPDAAVTEVADGGAGPARDAGPVPAYTLDGTTRLPRANQRSPLGTNLTFMKDFSGEWVFVDAFKQSRAWLSGNVRGDFGEAHDTPAWDDRRPLDLDDRGWVRSLQPDQVARALFYWYDRKVRYPAGRYVVLYDGDGTLSFENARVVEARPGRVVVEPDPGRGGFALNLTATRPDDYVRNIRVLMPGGACKDEPHRACRADADCAEGACVSFEESYARQLFHPTFLDRTKTYGALRYKDWMDIDHSLQREWEDRPKLTDAQWTRRGVPIEVLTELSNRLQVDTWVNVPHLASDAYVEALARYLATHLDPALHIYVEHSNEVWNPVFTQARWLADRARALGVDRDPYRGQLLLHARRSRAIFRIFEQVLGSRRRLVRVLGSHPANPWSSEQLLRSEEAYKEVDVLAITGYFAHRLGRPEAAARVKAASMDQLMDEIERDAEATMRLLAEHMAIAKKYGVGVVAYEGGEHLVALGAAQQDRALNEKLDQASRHPRMKAIYLAHLARWRAAGGGLFMHFVNCAVPTRFGRFGALEDLAEPRSAAPKFDALQTFIERTPRWW